MVQGKLHSALAAIALVSAIMGTTAMHSSVPNPFSWALATSTQPSTHPENSPATSFFVVAGGGAPSYNEIALEKNVHYFQRTLDFMGWDPDLATILFANGNSGEATIRYLDFVGRERFKVPEIENLAGAANLRNVQTWLNEYPQTANGTEQCPAFLYFTGHGALNEENPDNNAMILWEEDVLTVQALAKTLDRWPADIPFVTMMAQCYSGSFANLIYEDGDPNQSVALQSRCGFFATVKTRPSVGCTPLVNEADYRDYSSSFFAGLSGRDRVGNAVPSADYDEDGTVSFAEAHAFAKVDGETPDWPISTSEAWLQQQATESDRQKILAMPISTWQTIARPEQQQVVSVLANKLNYDLRDSFAASPLPKERLFSASQEVLNAYRMRLQMELINIGMEHQLRDQGPADKVAILEKLLACEAGTW